MKPYLTIAGLLVCTTVIPSLGQQHSISGRVTSESGETLIGATVSVPALAKGVSTNNYGFYTFSLPSGEHTILVSYVGYGTQRQEVQLTADRTINFSLLEDEIALNEVVVSADRKDDFQRKADASVHKIEAQAIKQIPMVVGESDIIKAIQLLPGVSSVNEGAGGFNVRGGSVDQNLVLLDEATVFNAAHLFGFFSVFNTDAIKTATLYKGGIPAEYGGRLSSVLDIYGLEGNKKRHEIKGGIGLLASRLMVNGPLAKSGTEGAKASYLVAARRSYADLFLRLSSDPAINQNTIYFYDVNAKVNYTANERNRFYLSWYTGRDQLRINNSTETGWGNLTGTLRWNHLFGPKLFTNTSLIYSDYNYTLGFPIGNQFNWKANLINYTLKTDFIYYLSDEAELKFGYATNATEFLPGEITPLGAESNVRPRTFPQKNSWENNVYGALKASVWDKLNLEIGIRLTNFNRLGSDSVKVYEGNQPIVYDAQSQSYRENEVRDYRVYDRRQRFGMQFFAAPRASLSYLLDSASSVKVSYNRMIQNIHLISNTTTTTPLDLYIPSGPDVDAQTADQISVGYFRGLRNNQFNLSVESFYKWIHRQYDFYDGATLLFNPNPENTLLPGEGRAYGVEFLLKKDQGNLTGWLSYTYSRSLRRITEDYGGPGINRGQEYASNFDKPHNLALVLSYQLRPRLLLATNFVFQSGRPATYPVSKYTYQGLLLPEYSDRNEYRLPSYHRLDFSLIWQGPSARRFRHRWIFGVYNVYNRQNAATIYFKEQTVDGSDDTPGIGVGKATQLTYYGIIPSVTWEFEF